MDTQTSPVTVVPEVHPDRPLVPGHRPRESDAREALGLVAALEAELHGHEPDRARLGELLARLEAVADRHEHPDLLAVVIRSYAQRARALGDRARSPHLGDVRAAMSALLVECFGPVVA